MAEEGPHGAFRKHQPSVHLLLAAEPTRAADAHGLALASRSEALNPLTPRGRGGMVPFRLLR